MKIKLSDIIDNIDNIRALGEVDFPVKVSYSIKRLIRKIQPEIDIYNEKRNEFIKELGEEDPKTKEFSVKDPEKLKEFGERLIELVGVEVEIDFIPISIVSLGDIKMSSNKIVDWMFAD